MIRKSSVDAPSPSKSSGSSQGNEITPLHIIRNDEGWTDEKIEELLNEMKQLIAKPDVSKYNTSLSRFDWETVKIGEFSGDECKNQFMIIYKKLRKYKTLSELVEESLEYIEYLKNQYKDDITKHPDHPKRPLTTYFRFFLSEREKCAAKHKDLTNLEITSIITKMYKKISIEEKERLNNEWKDEMVDYHRLLEQFKKDHPEYYEEAPPCLSRTAMQIFNHETEPDTPTTPRRRKASNINKDQDILKKNYHDLSDQEKLPYILKAIEEWEKYKEELEMYKKSHPDFIPTAAQNKCTLAQSDWRIYDKGLGKPDRPPANGYNLFSTRMMLSSALKHVPSRDRLTECGHMWNLLSDAKKKAHHKEFLSLRSNYAAEMKSFMKSLTPPQRQEYLKREKDAESKKIIKRLASMQVMDERFSESEEQEAISSTSHPLATAISALILYQKAHKEKFAANHPDVPKSDIAVTLERRFNNLPEEKKAKWIQQEKEQKALHDDMLRKKLLEDEPEPGPITGEQMFQEKFKEIYLKKANGSLEKGQKLMRRAWIAMNKKKRKKYSNAARERNAMDSDELEDEKEPDPSLVTGEQMFQEKLKEMYMEKANGSRKKGEELMRRAWKSMNKKRKKKYITAAHERNAMNSDKHPPAKTAAKEIPTSLTPQQMQENLQRKKPNESKKTTKRRASIQVKDEVQTNGGSTFEEEKEEEEEPSTKRNKSSKKVATISSPSHRPATSISALFLYQKAHKEKFAAKYPNASKSDMAMTLARRFNNLPEEKMAKWIEQEKEQRVLHDDMLRKKMLEEEKTNNASGVKLVTGEEMFQEKNREMYMQKADGSMEKWEKLMRRGWTSMNKRKRLKYITVADEQNAINSAKDAAAKAEMRAEKLPEKIQAYLALEPKKAPHNGFALFKAEQEPRLKHLETFSARNWEMSKMWSSMTTNAKNQHRARVRTLKDLYEKKLERWKKSLPPQALEAYMARLEKMPKAKSKTSNDEETVTNGTPHKRKSESKETASAPKKTKLSKEDSSDESSGDEDSSTSSDDSDSSSSDSDSSDSEEKKTPKKSAAKKDESSEDSSSSDDDSD